MKSGSLWTECGGCQKQISVNAKSCPHCGAKLKRHRVLKWTGGAFLALVVVGGIVRTNNPDRNPHDANGTSTTSSRDAAVAATKEPEAALPASQRDFLARTADYRQRFQSTANELQQSALRDERRSALLKALNSGLTVERWTGTLRKLETNTEGKAIVTVRLAPGVDLLTWNNSISDAMHQTMIDKGTSLYAALMTMSVGDPVTVSGSFLSSDQDGVWETSMTIDGSMTAPEFLFHFTNISKQ